LPTHVLPDPVLQKTGGYRFDVAFFSMTPSSLPRYRASGDPRPVHTLDKATVLIDGQPLLAHTKVRRDRIDKTGCFTLRYRSKLHHVGVGRAHRGKRVLILVADLDIRVIDQDGVMIRHLELDPSVDYQRRDRDTV
jgi:hypothetical protein